VKEDLSLAVVFVLLMILYSPHGFCKSLRIVVSGDTWGHIKPWVSANMHIENVKTYRLIETKNFKVAITAITGETKKDKFPQKAFLQALKKDKRKLPQEDIDLIIGGTYGRGKDEIQHRPYTVWFHRSKGAVLLILDIAEEEGKLKLKDFKTILLDRRYGL